jgi:hypothetical protein
MSGRYTEGEYDPRYAYGSYTQTNWNQPLRDDHQHMMHHAPPPLPLSLHQSSSSGSGSHENPRRISPVPSNYSQYYPASAEQQSLHQHPHSSDETIPRGGYSTLDTQNSRHARRLYVGGIPPGHTSEEQLKLYLNDVIHKCLSDDPVGRGPSPSLSSTSPSFTSPSYILSIYMNHKKCFAFIELCSIELASACLELDGIVYLSSVLKIQRANEYKPELVANIQRNPIRFNPSKAPFPHNTAAIESHNLMLSHSSHCIRMCSISDVTPGSVVLIGFPHDEGAKRSGITAGSAAGPAAIRFYLRKLLSSTINPEFGIDLSRLQILDVGDVPLGLTLEDALSRLDDSVIEVFQRGAVPIVLGGSGDLSYACASGLMTATGVPIAVVDVNSSLNMEPLVCSLLPPPFPKSLI